MTRGRDTLTLESRVSAGPRTYRFHTAAGVLANGSFRTAELLLADELWDVDLGELLCLQANYGVVGTVLAHRASAVHMVETSARAANRCERNARENDAPATTSLLADVTALETAFDAVAYAPKPYTPVPVVNQRIVDALSVLRQGGRLYLAGSPDAGLTRYTACLRENATAVTRVGERADCRLLRATRGPAVGRPTYVEQRTLRPEVDGTSLSLVTVPGLFAATSLDDGTRLLMEAVSVDDGQRVLDICCGYGPIGTYAGSVADCEVWLSDDDRVGTACAERSLDESNVEGTVVTADCASGVGDRQFDTVVCNPPTHAGGALLSELFDDIAAVLAPGGTLVYVRHSDLDLRHYLSTYDSIEPLRSGGDHVVLRATR